MHIFFFNDTPNELNNNDYLKGEKTFCNRSTLYFLAHYRILQYIRFYYHYDPIKANI